MQVLDAYRAFGWQFVPAEAAQDFRSALLSYGLPFIVVPVDSLSLGDALIVFLD